MATKTPSAGPLTKPAAKQATPDAPKKRVSPKQFFDEVNAERKKITWTSRKETWITAVMVFVMVILSSIFFLLVDYGLGFSTRYLLTNFAA